jgi:glycosyltransferase involved in cell wall biosynthesis
MISVCVLTFNGEKYIAQQLTSILCQLGPLDEVIVSDDNSSDGTLTIIELLRDDRIKIFKNNKKTNIYSGIFTNVFSISQNCQSALMHSSGDFIFLSDQDDIWESNKVARVMQELTACDMVIHNCCVVDADMNVLNDNYFLTTPARITLFGMLIKSSFMGCCMAFNRRIKELSLPFPDNEIEHDAWLGMCAIKHGKIKVVNENLLYYRRHGGNISSCSQKSPNKFIEKLWRRVVILKAYFIV